MAAKKAGKRSKTRKSDALARPSDRKKAGFTAGIASPLNDLPIGAKCRVARLNSLVAVRAEAGRLYRESRQRHGKHPDATTAFRLSRILSTVAASIELQDLEQRIQALEAIAEEKRRR